MKAIPLTDALHAYIVDHCQSVHPVLPRLIEETRSLPGAMMQVSPDQGALMHLLAKLTGARRIVELGCYTGYSAICLGAALPEGGKLYTLDVNPDTTAIAQRYFGLAGLESKIELRLAPGLETLAQLEQEHGAGSFDMMFIDADKEGMPQYYEWGLKLLRPGGLILADNVLWNGAVVDPSKQDASTVAIRRFNDLVKTDERVDRMLLHVSDGLYVIRKR